MFNCFTYPEFFRGVFLGYMFHIFYHFLLNHLVWKLLIKSTKVCCALQLHAASMYPIHKWKCIPVFFLILFLFFYAFTPPKEVFTQSQKSVRWRIIRWLHNTNWPNKLRLYSVFLTVDSKEYSYGMVLLLRLSGYGTE